MLHGSHTGHWNGRCDSTMNQAHVDFIYTNLPDARKFS